MSSMHETKKVELETELSWAIHDLHEARDYAYFLQTGYVNNQDEVNAALRKVVELEGKVARLESELQGM